MNGKKDGHYKAVGSNGTRLVEGRYSNGVRVGHWTVFWPNGFQPYESGEFDNDGKKTGLWNENEFNGRNIAHGYYHEDKKTGKWIYDKDSYNPKYYICGDEVTEREWNSHTKQQETLKRLAEFESNSKSDGMLSKIFKPLQRIAIK